ELGEGKLPPVRQGYIARHRIDCGRSQAIAQRDTAVAPPPHGLELDLGEADLLREQRRQQDAIVSESWLVSDHCNGIAAERALGQFLDETHRGHAVADDDERLAHRSSLK